MPQKVIKFKGINRSINEYSTSGECEEVINLRTGVDGGINIVKPKQSFNAPDGCAKYYVHSFGNMNNEILVSGSGVIAWIEPRNTVRQVISSDFESSDVDITFAGNVMLAYSKSEKRQLAFKFDDEKYSPYSISIPIIYGAHYSGGSGAVHDWYSVTAIDNSEDAINDAIDKASSGFHSKWTNGLCGAIIVGCTVVLETGEEVWSSGFTLIDETGDAPSYDPNSNTITVQGLKRAYISIKHSGFTDGIKRINVYSTRPVYKYYYSGGSMNVKSMEELGIDKQLMYYQGSISKESNELLLSFDKVLSGEQIMNITSGCIAREGEAFSYNNRFHVYNSDVYHKVQSVSITNEYSSGDGYATYIKLDGKWYLLEDESYPISTTNNFIYPLSGVERLAFVRIDDGAISEESDMFYVDMKDSQTYNFSYAFDFTPDILNNSKDFLKEIEGQMWGKDYPSRIIKLKYETNTINVSYPLNPFVFPIEYSYNIGGDILDVAVSYMPISAVQAGQYPLTVFTTTGIYAMEQGVGSAIKERSSSVLYSNIVPLQPHIINGKAIATPHGAFFFSSDNIYLLSGREALNISEIMHGKVEANIRGLKAYTDLCMSKTNGIHDFSEIISDKEFKDFIADASFSYDQLRDELIISCNSDEIIPYSYVLNIPSKTYHKIDKRYQQFQSGARYVLSDDLTSRQLVDLRTEETKNQHILLQTRPMSLEALNTHIQRLILLTDAKLDGNQYLFLTVFGSDNLYDWKCIISSQKKDTVLRHIRTNKAAKSYKDYVILINGVVSTDTDLSDLIADYTVVNRRLG